MLQFLCDYCENVKQPGEAWINGLAAENVGTKAARREVVIDPSWRHDRALLLLAVHFCCLDCKDNYLAELFNQPVALLEDQRVEVEPSTGRRTVRAKKKSAGKILHKRTTTSRKTRLH
jgi:hypothetical protein